MKKNSLAIAHLGIGHSYLQGGWGTAQIREAFVASDETYGMSRIRAELMDAGIVANCKRIAALMRQEHMRGVSRRRSFCITTERDVRHRPAPDLVNREFVLAHWIGSIDSSRQTAPISYGYRTSRMSRPGRAGNMWPLWIGVYARRIVGWRQSSSMRTHFVLDALEQALYDRRIEQSPTQGARLENTSRGLQRVSVIQVLTSVSQRPVEYA